MRFVRMILEKSGEIGRGGSLDESSGGFALVRVHPHVEGTLRFGGETAGRVIDLHGRDPEVCEEDVGGWQTGIGVGSVEGGEVGAQEDSAFGAEPVLDDALLSPWELDGIGVEREESALGLDEFEDFKGMASVTKGAIDGGIAGRRVEQIDDLFDHDRAVGSGRGFPTGEDLGQRFGILSVLFVLLVEAARVFTAVSWTPLMDGRSGVLGGVHSWLYFWLDPFAFSTG